jgi:outer membrane lipoprotein-sorting protein
MIDRRGALRLGLSTLFSVPLAVTAFAQAKPGDQADIARVEAYLNGLHSLKARFIQTAPDGGIAQGDAMVLRPGRMRFQYDAPSPFLLVANYGTLYFHDSQLHQTSNIPLSRTPLGMLLADRVTLSGDITVTAVNRLPGQLLITMVRSATPGEGSLTLYFADSPLTLRQWVVLDQQGKQTRVSLDRLDTSARIDPKLFEYREDSNITSGGG